MLEQLELFKDYNRVCTCCKSDLTLGAYNLRDWSFNYRDCNIMFCFNCIRVTVHTVCKKCYNHCKCIPHPLQYILNIGFNLETGTIIKVV